MGKADREFTREIRIPVNWDAVADKWLAEVTASGGDIGEIVKALERDETRPDRASIPDDAKLNAAATEGDSDG